MNSVASKRSLVLTSSYEFLPDAISKLSTSAASVTTKPVPRVTTSFAASLRWCCGRAVRSRAASIAAPNMSPSATNATISEYTATLGLPVERHSDRGPVHRHSVVTARREVVIDVSPHADQLAPAELVAKAAVGLKCELVLAGSNVDVVRNEPLVTLAEAPVALGPDNGIPVVHLHFARPLPARPYEGTDVSAEVPAQILLEVDQSRPGEQRQGDIGRRHEVITAGERP